MRPVKYVSQEHEVEIVVFERSKLESQERFGCRSKPQTRLTGGSTGMLVFSEVVGLRLAAVSIFIRRNIRLTQ